MELLLEREESENLLSNLCIFKVGLIASKIDIVDLIEIVSVSKSICQVSIAISDSILIDSLIEIKTSELCVLDFFSDGFDIGSVFVVIVVLKALLVPAELVFCAHSLLLKDLSSVVHQLRTQLMAAGIHPSDFEMLDIDRFYDELVDQFLVDWLLNS